MNNIKEVKDRTELGCKFQSLKAEIEKAQDQPAPKIHRHGSPLSSDVVVSGVWRRHLMAGRTVVVALLFFQGSGLTLPEYGKWPSSMYLMYLPKWKWKYIEWRTFTWYFLDIQFNWTIVVFYYLYISFMFSEALLSLQILRNAASNNLLQHPVGNYARKLNDVDVILNLYETPQLLVHSAKTDGAFRQRFKD